MWLFRYSDLHFIICIKASQNSVRDMTSHRAATELAMSSHWTSNERHALCSPQHSGHLYMLGISTIVPFLYTTHALVLLAQHLDSQLDPPTCAPSSLNHYSNNLLKCQRPGKNNLTWKCQRTTTFWMTKAKQTMIRGADQTKHSKQKSVILLFILVYPGSLEFWWDSTGQCRYYYCH